MSNVALLAGQEQYPDRPFTDPQHTACDYGTLADALDSLRRLLLLPGTFGVRQEWQENGLYRRLILGDCTALRTLPRLIFVGFFGQRRRDVTVARINLLDEDLLAELAQQPGVLAYYTLELADAIMAIWCSLTRKRPNAIGVTVNCTSTPCVNLPLTTTTVSASITALCPVACCVTPHC